MTDWILSKRRLKVFAAAMVVILMLTGWSLQPVATAQSDGTPSPAAEESTDESGTEITSELPPPDIPASNQFGYSFDFDSALTSNLENVPREAQVYALEVDPISVRQAQKITDRLEIDAEVTEREDGSFEASGNGEVFIAPELIQYFSLASPTDEDLPEDEAAVGFAREWLRQKVLLPKNADDGRVVDRSDETDRVIVQFLPSEPAGILSAYPAVVVTLGPGGIVFEASSRWADVDRADLYQLRSVDVAWDEVQSGQAYLEVDVSTDDAEPGASLVGDATYDSVGLSYTTAGPPGGGQYLVPIYVFSGKVELEGMDRAFPIRAYVPAIANSGAPVG